MVFDAANHPDPTAFERWASRSNGKCPYTDVKVARAATFNQKKEHWPLGQACRPYDLMTRVLAEKCPDWTDEQRTEFVKKFEGRNGNKK